MMMMMMMVMLYCILDGLFVGLTGFGSACARAHAVLYGVFVGMRVSLFFVSMFVSLRHMCDLLTFNSLLLFIQTRIVEYATRDQAQNAVSILSNQPLMGRLVYVREVCVFFYVSIF